MCRAKSGGFSHDFVGHNQLLRACDGPGEPFKSLVLAFNGLAVPGKGFHRTASNKMAFIVIALGPHLLESVSVRLILLDVENRRDPLSYCRRPSGGLG